MRIVALAAALLLAAGPALALTQQRFVATWDASRLTKFVAVAPGVVRRVVTAVTVRGAHGVPANRPRPCRPAPRHHRRRLCRPCADMRPSRAAAPPCAA